MNIIKLLRHNDIISYIVQLLHDVVVLFKLNKELWLRRFTILGYVVNYKAISNFHEVMNGNSKLNIEEIILKHANKLVRLKTLSMFEYNINILKLKSLESLMISDVNVCLYLYTLTNLKSLTLGCEEMKTISFDFPSSLEELTLFVGEEIETIYDLGKTLTSLTILADSLNNHNVSDYCWKNLTNLKNLSLQFVGLNRPVTLYITSLEAINSDVSLHYMNLPNLESLKIVSCNQRIISKYTTLKILDMWIESPSVLLKFKTELSELGLIIKSLQKLTTLTIRYEGYLENKDKEEKIKTLIPVKVSFVLSSGKLN